jgi:hypothetical protein
MSETAGDVLSMASRQGEVEARRMGRADSGLSRWQVRFPWGTETFFGTSADISRHVRTRIAQQEGAQAPRRPD